MGFWSDKVDRDLGVNLGATTWNVVEVFSPSSLKDKREPGGKEPSAARMVGLMIINSC